ncbi:MAG: hypothetical protein V2L15_09870 [Desulfobacteraceae bacterium]|nr:hypothetical protein [Desulfobacteraceae bacterium]
MDQIENGPVAPRGRFGSVSLSSGQVAFIAERTGVMSIFRSISAFG